jgi:hypothetical protein
MIQQVPDIEHKIHKGQSHQNFEPGWGLDEIQDSKILGLDIGGGTDDGRGKNQVENNTVK